ncbi:MAG: cache domain-containing protein [Deltaproteobacteria bacterium]|nr:cache domain-containing protein [Deltaproteobacteria bacterium]
MKPKRRLTQILLFLMSGVSLASVALLAVLWINFERAQSKLASEKISRDYYENWENTVSLETQAVYDHIAAQTTEGQVGFYQGVKKQALEAYNSLAQQDLATLKANQSLALALVGGFMGEGERAKYFVLDLKGRVLTKPDLDYTEDPEAQAIIKSLLEHEESYYRFDFAQSWPDQEEKPVAYLKVFEPLGWIVGAASLFEDYQAQAQAEQLAWAANMPRSWGGHLLILDYSGKVLAFAKEELVGKNLFEEGDSLLTKAASRLIRGAKERQSSFLRFPILNDSGETSEAVGHYRAIEAWRWVAVNYVDSGDLAKTLLIEQNDLDLSLRRQMVNVITITLLMLLVIGILSHYISRKASRGFEDFYRFFENAASSSVEMDPESQSFNEFALLAESVNRMIGLKREATELLATSEAKFRAFFELSPQLITITDEDGCLREANMEFAKFIGRDLSEAVGHDLGLYFPVDPRQRDKLKNQALAGELVTDQEMIVLSASGAEVTFLFACKGLIIGEKTYFLSVYVDITALKKSENERSRLQEKLARSQRMEGMGLMAAQVAHELNNILSGLVGYPELLLRDPSLTESQRELAQETREAGLRAAAVVSDLLTMTKGLASVQARVDINDLVRGVLALDDIQSLLTRRQPPVRLETRLSPAGVEVMGSESHLKKVIHNILENAIEAVSGDPRGHQSPSEPGLVTISTDQAYLKEPFEGIDNFQPGQFAVIAIKDNGPGVPENEASRIFEPFYSQKANGGLGLAVVSLIAREHGGAVELKTWPKGAEFRVWLPIATITKPATPKTFEEYRGQGQKVLVVDDVDIQRKLAQKMLKTLGYETHSVASGEEALEYLRDNEADLVVLDMIMPPGWNGRQTYEAILAIRPGQKAIIASGMAEGEEVKKAQALGARHFLAKPYTLEDIAGAVHSAIAGQ